MTRRLVFGVAVLAVACAPRAQQVPSGAPAVSAKPSPPELAALEAAFRTQDREVSDQLAGDAPLDCHWLQRPQDELGRLAAKVCAISNTQEGGRTRWSGSCRYALERSHQLSREAERRGCKRRVIFSDPMMH